MTFPTPTPVPGWYPDQTGRHELRYWDGIRWTPHVATAGRQFVDGPPTSPLFAEQTLVFLETRNTRQGDSFSIRDRAATEIGTAREVGGSAGSRVLGHAFSMTSNMTRTVEVHDRDGNLALVVSRPAKLMKSRVSVRDGHGIEVGVIRQENVVGAVDFALERGGVRVGRIKGEGVGVLRTKFSVTDAHGAPVARIDKELPPDLAGALTGLAGAVLSGADTYLVEILVPLAEPLRSLVVASALAIDTALHDE